MTDGAGPFFRSTKLTLPAVGPTVAAGDKKSPPRDEPLPPNREGDCGNGQVTPQGEDDIDREERDLLRRIVEAPELAHDPEPQRLWIGEDVIPDETLTLLTGEGGIGKTTLALQLAVAMRIDGAPARHEGGPRARAVCHFGG